MRLAAWSVFIRVNFSSKCASCIYYTLYKEVQQICICHDLEFGKWEVVFGVWDLVFRVDKEVRSLREHSTSLVEEHTNVPRHTIAIFTNCIRAQLHRYCTKVAPACTMCTSKHPQQNITLQITTTFAEQVSGVLSKLVGFFFFCSTFILTTDPINIWCHVTHWAELSLNGMEHQADSGSWRPSHGR